MRREREFWKRTHKTASFALILLVGACAIPILAGETAKLTHTVTAGDYEIRQDDGVQHVRMLASGYSTLNSPGNPSLPEMILEFRVPSTIEWSTLQLSVLSQQQAPLPGSYNIDACSPEIVEGVGRAPLIEWGIGKRIVNGRNVIVYDADAAYPAQSVELLPYTVRQERVNGETSTNHYARVAFRPFAYNPARQELTLIEGATLQLTYEYAEETSLPRIQADTHDLVIITTNNIVAHSEKLDNFIALKEFEGYDVLVVTETDYGPLAGAETADKIRQWLINNDAAMGIEYVLLIGDPNPDDPSDAWVDVPSDPFDAVGDVPMKMSWIGYTDWEAWRDWAYHGYPTDMYYADLSGDWDLDNDGLYGESIDIANPASPYPGEAGFDDGTYSVIWDGQLEIPHSTTYRFHTFSDDGVRLEVDGTVVFVNRGPHDWPINEFSSDLGNSGDLWLAAGKYDITLEYDNFGGDGIIRLWWQTPTLADNDPNYLEQIIPAARLFDGSDVSGGLDGTYYTDSSFTTVGHTRKDPTIDFVWATGDLGPGGVDYGAENFVGRIPVYNHDYAQLDDILDKIITYETDQGDISWRESLLVAVNPLSTTTPAYQYGEQVIDDITDPAGFVNYRIYNDDYSASGGPTPEDWPSTIPKVRDEWSNGYGVVTWWTHGSPEGASSVFDTGAIPSLDDTTPAFTYQATCLNGYPENDNNLGYALLEHGAIATVCATRVSSGSRGDWTYDPNSSANPNWGYKYLQHLLIDGYTSGQALYNAKDDVTSISRNLMNYNLYGDPTITFSDIIANSPPIAAAGGPYHVDEGSDVTLDASGSSDPDGYLLTYEWDLDNDGEYDDATGVTVTYHGIDDASVIIGLRVSDGVFEETDTTTLTVHNVAPEVTATCGMTIQENREASLDISIHDEGVLDTFTVEVDWGDGSPHTVVTPGDDGDAVVHLLHLYLDDNPSGTPSDTYSITVMVTDDDDGTGSDSDTVTVVNVNPEITLFEMGQPNPQFILPVVHELTFTGDFVDQGPLDTHAILWQFGDGDTASTLLAAHTYMAPGSYTASLTILDDDTGVDIETMEVNVVDEFGALDDLVAYIQGLPDDAFKLPPLQRKNALVNMLSAVRDMLTYQEYNGAISDLTSNVRAKADGLIDGNEKDDWIVDLAAQQHICMKIDDITAYLAYLLDNL